MKRNIKSLINLKNSLIACSAIIALIVGSTFLLMYSARKAEESSAPIEVSTSNSFVITPDDMGSQGELMFAYIGKNNYLYNLDDESKPLIEQPASLLLYASDDTVIYVASAETDENHLGRESIIQELQIGEHENNLYTIATVSLDPCWSSNDEVVYFVKDDKPTQLCTFEPLTSTTEMAAEFSETITGLRISSDGLLVTVESGEEKLYVPLSKSLTPTYYNCQGSRIMVCEQYDLILTPSGELFYRWLGSNEATKISTNVVVAKGYQDNEILFVTNTTEGKSLNAYYVSEEFTKELSKLPDNIMPQLTVSANYAFLIDSYKAVYKYDIDTNEFYNFCIVDDTVANPMISVFDYRLMIYDLSREIDQTFVTASDATRVPTDSEIAEINAYLEEKNATISEETAAYIDLEMASIGSEVQELQTQLINLGYLNSAATGIYDVSTTVAVQKLQYDLGLPQTGIANGELQAQLLSNSIASTNGYPVISTSSEGVFVRDLQTRLRTLGYTALQVNGKFDENTINALKLFSEQNGIEYDGGIVKSDFFKAIFDASAIKYSGYLSLKKGDCHTSVTNLNERLKELGYLAGSVNPSFDDKTVTALILYASVNNISLDNDNLEIIKEIFDDNAKVCPDELKPKALDDTVPSNPNQVISDRQLKIIRKWLTKQFAVNHTDKQAVKRLQMQLVRLGYMNIDSVSMIYDKTTFDAVSVFQKANDIFEDGIASKNTLTEIFRSEINRTADADEE